MIKHLGREGIAAIIEQNCRVAQVMAGRLRADNGIAILNDVSSLSVSASTGRTKWRIA